MLKIDIIGTGNVGTHLCRAFADKADVVAVSSRLLSGLRHDSDIYLISVTDDAIRQVAHNIAGRIPSSAILAHTSGTTPMDALDGCAAKTGVFYPLQTFSKNVGLRYDEIPFFIEGSDPETASLLKSAASAVSVTVREMDSQNRQDLHIASVFSCNFINHLWALAAEYLADKGIDFNLLHPLIRETVNKIGRVAPYDAQTGPAVRHDTLTIDRHLEKLGDDSELSGVYRLLTDSIMNHHPREASGGDKTIQ